MPSTPQDTSLNHFYYDKQLKKHITQFMAIFSGLKVSHGKNDFDSTTNLQEVPIVYGSRDRVVSHIFSENTQNKMLVLPMLSAQLMGLEIAVDRLVGQGQTRKETKLPSGGSIPDDLKVVETLQSIPYRAQMELAINASNTDQHFQILEQILLLFNPSLQIQVSDSYGNRQKILEVYFDSMMLDENYPADNDRRMISSLMNMKYVFYLTPPSNVTENMIKNIQVRLSTIDSTNPLEINNGILDAFIIDTEGAPKK